MSVLVKDNANFVGLLLSTTAIQAQALLDTATRKQIRVLSQIAGNLLTIPLAGESKKIVELHQNLLRKISNSNLGQVKKGKIIGRHRKKIIQVLKAVTPILQALIQNLNEKSEEKHEIIEKNVS